MKKVTIVGCGIIGAAIAYELSLVPGLEITVLEKQTKPATGSTGAALGVLMGIISHKIKNRAWQLRETSIKRYATLIPELEAQTGIKIPVNHHGIVKLLFSDLDNLESWQQLKKIRHSQGWSLEIWDRNELTRRCPQIINKNIIGAVYSPQDKQINPAILTQALVKAAIQNGVEFQFGVTIKDFMTSDRTCDRLITSNGDLELDWLIISAGLGSTPITASLLATVDIRPVLGQALKLRLDESCGDANFQPVITGNDRHLVPLGNNEYWLGATVEFPGTTGEVVADSELLAEIKQDTLDFCPMLADATILETWSGMRPRPQGKSAPIIEPLSGYDNVLLATGHYRNGILLAPATAKAIERAIDR
jgi:glycine/D-amino acid oxidase-like deaminating enzyme